MNVKMFTFAGDFLSLFYPQVCAGCGKSLARGEEVLCSLCEYKLPSTGYHLYSGNPVEQLFWGRIRIEAAAAFFHFARGTRIQRLLHLLKYHGSQNVGLWLGKVCGNVISRGSVFTGVNLIVPVPLHAARLRTRGFNQSAVIADGISSATGIPWEGHAVHRLEKTATQTRKKRTERWENVSSAFHVRDGKVFEGRHILLVDDVVTTGATLEACASRLLEIRGVTVSIAAVAVSME